MCVRCYDNGKLVIRNIRDVLNDSFHRLDVASSMDAAINKDMCTAVAIRTVAIGRKRNQETVAKADPVHANANAPAATAVGFGGALLRSLRSGLRGHSSGIRCLASAHPSTPYAPS